MSAELMTPAQVAEALDIAEQTVRVWLDSGKLRGQRNGRDWRIAVPDLAAFLQAGERDDYDEPLTADEAAESDAAWRAYLAGDDPGDDVTEIRRALVGARRA